MKKTLSIILSMLLIMTMAPMAFAEVIANSDAPIAIAADGETIIELEAYNTGELTNADGTTAQRTIPTYTNEENGKSYLHTGHIAGTNLVQTLEVSVAEAGSYDIEVVHSTGDASSKIKFAVDGTTVQTYYYNATEIAAIGEYFHEHFKATKTVFRVDLSAGSHKLAISYPERSGSLAGTIAFAADCVKFTPAEENTVYDVAKSGTTTIEMEELTYNTKRADQTQFYIRNFATPTVTETAEDGSTTEHTILALTEKKYDSQPLVMTIPIDIEKAGWYDVDAFLLRGQTYLSITTLRNQTRGTILRTTNGTNPYRTNQIYSYKDQAGYQYESRVYMPAGEQNLILNIATRAEGTAGGIFFWGDKITLTPVELPAEERAVISENGGTIEYEAWTDYISNEMTVNVKDATTNPDNKASGSSFIQFDTGTNRSYEFYMDIPVTVEKSGVYDVELIASNLPTLIYFDGAATSLQRGKMLDKTWSSNTGDYYCLKWFPAHPYTGRVYLTAGEHVFTTKSPLRAAENNDLANAYDCIRFTPAESKVFITSNKAMINVAYETPVIGTAIAAFYEDNQLKHLATKEITEETQAFDIETITDAKPDKVKVFLWESVTGAKPTEDVITITDIEYITPALYLLGDSVCAHYNSDNFWQQGWGDHIMSLFGEDITIINKAIGGKSSKTYRENPWENLYYDVKYGDYVMINFGLNDYYNISETGKGTSLKDYEMYLNLYCDEIKAKGATPILISPMPECKTSHNSLIARSAVMEKVAEEQGIVFLPLNDTLNYQWILDENGNYSETMSKATFDYYFLSETAYKRLEAEYVAEVPQSQWDYIHSTNDRTHINIDGAQHVAQTIADLLAESDSPLKSYLK